uniref:Putative ovule protein n=1 Tax=Solanum chacoense TaxID=4108 RepID=A0A0V0HCY5_SOLCH
MQFLKHHMNSKLNYKIVSLFDENHLHSQMTYIPLSFEILTFSSLYILCNIDRICYIEQKMKNILILKKLKRRRH